MGSASLRSEFEVIGCDSVRNIQYSTSTYANANTNSQLLYKTELCKSFAKTGNCKYGSTCLFAHGIWELQFISHSHMYKTQECADFKKRGKCWYGRRCRYIHSSPDEDEWERVGLDLLFFTAAIEQCQITPVKAVVNYHRLSFFKTLSV